MRHAPGASTDPQPVIRVPSTAAPAPRPWQRAPRRPRPSRWVPWPLNPTASAGLSTAPGPWPRPAAATRPAGQPHRGGGAGRDRRSPYVRSPHIAAPLSLFRWTKKGG